ncbi:hypothetical protein PN462_20530 [Spirulina sp. CS-785/01]|uniref:hypothetical protein n=1 Tax=Spirulina sp. CS-785/01 TaxID=3021716 RepID=UPI0023311944|nr:hypothetical protein [Spirulina sp. CS-785/01]MDB9315512.1 hypothetical protein [Spirulina sp. CS-785/01]
MEQLANLLPHAITELYASAARNHKLTLADRYGLQTAILEGHLTQEEEWTLNRILRAVWRQDIEWDTTA